MSYWHRPKFWLLLFAAEVGAFLLSGIAATVVAILCVLVGMAQHHMVAVTYVVGLPVNTYLAWDAFRWIRGMSRQWPQPRPPQGFPVIVKAADRRAG